MKLRTFVIAAAVACTLSLAMASPSSVVPVLPQQWDFPAAEGRIVAIGDIHGDFDAMMRILEESGVVSRDGTWIAEPETHLVFNGDLIDRGAHSRFVFDFIMGLERQAEARGGHVHALIGNHEYLAMVGSTTFQSLPDELAWFGTGDTRKGGYLMNYEAWKAQMKGDGVYGKWFESRPAVVRIGDTLFVHGGLEPWLASKSPAWVNEEVRKVMHHLREHAPFDPTGATIYEPAPPFESSLFLKQGPLRSRAMSQGVLSQSEVDAILRAWGAKRIVLGHEPLETIRQSYDRKVVNIDTGISRQMEGTLSALEIRGSTLTPRTFRRPIDEHPLLDQAKRDVRAGMRPFCERMGARLAQKLKAMSEI